MVLDPHAHLQLLLHLLYVTPSLAYDFTSTAGGDDELHLGLPLTQVIANTLVFRGFISSYFLIDHADYLVDLLVRAGYEGNSFVSCRVIFAILRDSDVGAGLFFHAFNDLSPFSYDGAYCEGRNQDFDRDGG